MTRDVVLVTGAGRGLGAELSVRLASAGYSVALMGRRLRDLEAVQTRIRELGGTASKFCGDVSNLDDCHSVVRATVKRFGSLYGVVNNAGIAGPTANLEDVSSQDWSEVINTNLTGLFNMCKASIPQLRRSGRGRIVSIGSVTGKRPLAGRTPYSSSKLGVVGLVRTLALELGRTGITVNNVSPWLLEGERLNLVMETQASVQGLSPVVILEKLVSETATGRLVTNDDVYSAIEFLLQDSSRNFTGQDLNISAGAVTY